MAKPVPIYKLTQPDAPLRESAPVLLVRLQEVMEFAPAIHDPANVEDLHDMRIAAKRLRYTLEIFSAALGPDTVAPLLATVTEIQERIGAIHDCDVLLPLLDETIRKETKREHRRSMKKGGSLPEHLAAEGLSRLMGEKRAERDRLYAEFVAFWDALPPERLAEEFGRLITPRGEQAREASDGAPLPAD
jgi:hypothetical protein